ncbi:MAG TPA: hypothetical protein VHI51_14000 [Ktedonobacterales bacterium]|nr:hypothetical protein [Ktedonobacterales bacterium]
MRDDGPPRAPTRVDEHEDDEFTRASLDPPRAAPSRMAFPVAALAAPFALRGARRRALTLAATALLVAVVVVGLFVHVTSNPGGAVGALLRLSTPTPAATFMPGANAIYFSNGVPWGSLTIDGKRMPQADLSGYGITVTRGAHQLVYRARYFPSVRCVFSAPQAHSDTCRLDTSADADQFLLNMAPLARVIDLGSTRAALPADQLAAIVQTANAQLRAQSATANIAPGERYLDDHGQVVVASEPLLFTMTLAIDDFPGDIDLNCAQICFAPNFSDGLSPGVGSLRVNAYVAVSWDITDSIGRSISSSAAQAGPRASAFFVTDLAIQPSDSGWRLHWLDALTPDAVEGAASAAANLVVNQVGQNSYGMSFMLALNPLDGCVMDVDDGNGSMRVFWRFGVLLSVNRIAHAVLPVLPVANAQEQAAASNIAVRGK